MDNTLKKLAEWNVDAMVQAIIEDEPDLLEHTADIRQALTEAKEGRWGRKTTVHVSPIAETRHKAGLSQIQFAECLGISVNTLRSWEQGQRKPSGAANVLLNLLHKRPELIAEL